VKTREWRDHAWELCRQLNAPGCVAIIEKAMEFGYGLGLSDATEEMKKMTDELREFRELNNAPK